MPLVIRGPQGGGHRLGAQHSQSLEAWFVNVPGLKVVMPSTASDAKGLLLAAVRDPNPVLFLEHKNLYQLPRSAVPSGDYEVALGVADVKRAGSDVTVVATSNMVHEALKAARRLQRQGVSLEVIDPRTLWPLDEALILQSVRKTSRLVIAHEAPRRGGWGAELLSLVQASGHLPTYRTVPPHYSHLQALHYSSTHCLLLTCYRLLAYARTQSLLLTEPTNPVQEKAFDALDAPITIVAGRDAPLPYNAALERACIPGANEIAAAALATMERPGRC